MLLMSRAVIDTTAHASAKKTPSSQGPAAGTPPAATPPVPNPGDLSEIAIVDGDRHLTYHELDELSAVLATSLRNLGIGPGARAIVAMRNRWEWFVVNAAIGRLGATRVAMNWRLEPAEAAYIAADSESAVAVIDTKHGQALVDALLETTVRTVLWLGEESLERTTNLGGLLAGAAAPDIGPVRPSPSVVYTSGTTGNPKGALRDDSNVSREIFECYQGAKQYDDVPRLSAGRVRMLLNMPMHHASGGVQGAAAIANRQMVVIQRQFDAEDTLRLIDELAITDWGAVPTMLNRVLSLPASTLSRYRPDSLVRVMVGAAPVPVELKERFVEQFGEGKLFEGYGSTETSMIAGMRPWEHRLKPHSCGRPFRHVSVRIRDEDGEELPAGSVGEIYVRTPQMISGYLNHPPLSTELLDADGRFRTGDVGYLDEHGYLYVTDRVKDMVISGGVNIYPAEIESYLGSHPAVADAAVIGIPDDDLGEAVVAYVQRRDGSDVTAEQLATFCAEGLASYKRPRRIEFVAELPHNEMGKVLKRALREPFWAGRERAV